MTDTAPFTESQLAALRELIADEVHAAVAPVARQMTTWVQKERARLADPRRRATGATSKPQGRFVPDHPKNQPPVDEKAPPIEPTVHVLGDPREV